MSARPSTGADGRASGRARLGVVLIGLVLFVSCAPNQTQLQDACDSLEALAAQVLDAYARNDRPSLERMALTEAEFRHVIWPELPAARPERNLPWHYVWKDLHQKSQSSLTQLLAEHAKRRYVLERVTFRGVTTPYSSYQVARDSELIVRDDSGAVHRIRLFGSVLHRAGRYKVFSFVVD